MQPVELNTPLFYQYRGFNREDFLRSANLAQQRLRQLQQETGAVLDLDEQAKTVNVHRNVASIPLVSLSLSVPRSLRLSGLSEPQLTLPIPNYQQFTPSAVELSYTPLDIYA